MQRRRLTDDRSRSSPRLYILAALLAALLAASLTPSSPLLQPSFDYCMNAARTSLLAAPALHRLAHLSGLLARRPIANTTSKPSVPPVRSMASGAPSSLPSVGFAAAVGVRHSAYALKSSLPAGVTDALVEGMVKDTLLNVPSAFNSQSTRLVLLVKDEHKKFWSGVEDTFRGKMDAETFGKLEGRLASHKAAYGSVLFYEDDSVVKEWAGNQPRYAAQFPQWSEHTSGMHQHTLWTALSTFKGLGANLQHYNYDPDITKMAASTFGLSSDWDLKAQLVFGETDDYPGTKEKLPLEKTLKVFGI